MKFKLQLFTLLVSCGILNAQDTIRSLVITEARLDRGDHTYCEITNMGADTVNLSDFEFGCIRPWATPYTPEADHSFMLPDHELLPGESYVIAVFSDWNMEQYYLDVAKYEYSPQGRVVFKPEMWELADLQIHRPESPTGDPTDSITMPYHWIMDDVWNGRECWYLRHHISETDSAVIDQVGGVFTTAEGRNPVEGAFDVAGVTGATANCVLVRKFTVKEGNLDFYNARGQDLDESEWMPIPFLSGQWEPNRAVFWTVGNHGDYNLDVNTLTSETIEIDGWNQVITVPWGVRRDDSIMYQFDRVPGLAWHYDYHHDTNNVAQSHEDSSYVSVRTGDKLTVYACGKDLDVIEFQIIMSEPTADANMVVPKRVLQDDGSYAGAGVPYRVSVGVPGMDTISEVPFATRTDTLLKYLEKAPNATWEFVWVDGTERTDLKLGDILRVTAEDGTSVKDYFIKVLRYRKSQNAYLASITWPDIPEDYRDFYGWIQDTIPNFVRGSFDYKVQVPIDYDGIPALLAKTEDVNAKLDVQRATHLLGNPADRVVTFTNTAEDDTTVYTYTVELLKEKDPEYIQPWAGEPFFSEVIFWEQWTSGMVEICNPGNVPLDLSDYMFYGGYVNNPANAITSGAGPDEWMNRFTKYVPGYTWVDSANWRSNPALLVFDPIVSPVVQPGDVFVMSSIYGTGTAYGGGGYGDGNWPAETQADVIFSHPSKPNTWGEPAGAVGAVGARQWRGADLYLFKIVGDSVKEGKKPANDPNDFELIETFGHNDGTEWSPCGKVIDMITTCIRKPEFILPKPEFEGSFGNTPDSSEWITMDRPYFDARGVGWPMDILRVVQDLGKHYLVEGTYGISTVFAYVYKVSPGYTLEETIEGVVTGTSVDDFLENIIKINEGQTLMLLSSASLDTLTGDDVLADGDTLAVLSFDKVNITKYVLAVADESTLSDDAVLTSDVYTITVTGETGTVTDIDYGTTLKDVLADITVPAGASLAIVDQNDAYLPTVKLNFDTMYVDVPASDAIFLEVVAENNTNMILYQLQPTALATDAFVTSDIFDVDQEAALIDLIPQGITANVFLANLVPATGASVVLLDKLGHERTFGEIYRDDKLVVTAQDGETTKVYYLEMLPAFEGDLIRHAAYILSDVYTVDQVDLTIGTPLKMAASAFLADVEPAAGATLMVVDASGAENTGNLNLMGDQVMVTAEDGVTVAYYEILVSTISVDDPALSPLQVYPNPSDGKVTISGLERGNRIRIYNATGAGVLDMIATQNREELSLEGHAAGMYFIMVNKADSVVGRYKLILK
jgi:hypothetical protein